MVTQKHSDQSERRWNLALLRWSSILSVRFYLNSRTLVHFYTFVNKSYYFYETSLIIARGVRERVYKPLCYPNIIGVSKRSTGLRQNEELNLREK